MFYRIFCYNAVKLRFIFIRSTKKLLKKYKSSIDITKIGKFCPFYSSVKWVFIRNYLRKNGKTVSFILPLMIDLVLKCLIMSLLFY